MFAGWVFAYDCRLLITFPHSLDRMLGLISIKMFDTLMVFLKDFLEKVNCEKNEQTKKGKLTLYLIETPSNTFANRTDLPDQGLLCLLMEILDIILH